MQFTATRQLYYYTKTRRNVKKKVIDSADAE